MTAPLSIGILGAARIADNAMVQPAALTGHRLVAVGARDLGRAQEFATRHGVERAVGSYAEVLADPEVEVVYNPLVNSLHAPWNVAAVEAGKHVLSEKPFAANGSEARAVAEVVRASGRVVMEAYHYAMHPLMERVRALLASGEIGDLRHVEVTMIIPAPSDSDPRWSYDLAGGAVMDLGCYGLHAFRQVSGGTPIVRAARGIERPGHPQVDEWVQAELDLPGGATAGLFTSMAGPEVLMRMTVTGTRGLVEAPCFVAPQVDDRLRIVVDGQERVESLGSRTSYAYQLEAFAAAVRGEAEPFLDLDDAVATMDLIDDVYRAAGMPVRPSSL